MTEDSATELPVWVWVEGEYGISRVYLGVEAEIGRAGVRRRGHGMRSTTQCRPSSTARRTT